MQNRRPTDHGMRLGRNPDTRRPWRVGECGAPLLADPGCPSPGQARQVVLERRTLQRMLRLAALRITGLRRRIRRLRVPRAVLIQYLPCLAWAGAAWVGQEGCSALSACTCLPAVTPASCSLSRLLLKSPCNQGPASFISRGRTISVRQLSGLFQPTCGRTEGQALYPCPCSVCLCTGKWVLSLLSPFRKNVFRIFKNIVDRIDRYHHH